ncbi:MAG: RNA polymerase sigma-70 factor [Bacteroidota bacterium]
MEQDKEVIHQFRSGNEDAFEQIFRAYYKALVHYAKTILKDMDDSEDIVQQVFVSVWEKRLKIEIHTSLRALLYKSVHNACLNKIKQQQVRSGYAKEVIQLHNEQGTTQDSMQQKELQHKIEAAMDMMPEQCAKIFKMSRFEQMKYQEIADTLNLSVKTIENQMGKALKIMREQLKEYLPLLIMILSQYYSE